MRTGRIRTKNFISVRLSRCDRSSRELRASRSYCPALVVPKLVTLQGERTSAQESDTGCLFPWLWFFGTFSGMRELTGVQVPGGWKVRRPKRLGVPGGATLPVSTLKDCLFPVLSVAVAFGNASTIAGGAGADAPARFLDTSHGFQRSPPPCHEIPGRTILRV